MIASNCFQKLFTPLEAFLLQFIKLHLYKQQSQGRQVCIKLQKILLYFLQNSLTLSQCPSSRFFPATIYQFCTFSLSIGTFFWNTFMECKKACMVYADFIKDSILLMIIIKALGGIYVLHDIGWTFAGTVSLKEISLFYLDPKSVVTSKSKSLS